MYHGVVQEVVNFFLNFIIISVDFADAFDPMCSSIVESIARHNRGSLPRLPLLLFLSLGVNGTREMGSSCCCLAPY